MIALASLASQRRFSSPHADRRGRRLSSLRSSKTSPKPGPRATRLRLPGQSSASFSRRSKKLDASNRQKRLREPAATFKSP